MATQFAPQGQGQAAGTCYNCGAFDHYMMSCPEPARSVPAGLIAARAAQPAQSSQFQQAGGFARGMPPFKKHKSNAVYTKFPGPPAPPVVTRYFPNGSPQGPSPPVGQWGPSAPAYQQQPNYSQPQQGGGYGYNPQNGPQGFYGPQPQQQPNYGYGQPQFGPGPSHSGPLMMTNGYQQAPQYPPNNMQPHQNGPYSQGPPSRHNSYQGPTPSPGPYAQPPQRHNSWAQPMQQTAQPFSTPYQQPYSQSQQPQHAHQPLQHQQPPFQTPNHLPPSQHGTPSSTPQPANSQMQSAPITEKSSDNASSNPMWPRPDGQSSEPEMSVEDMYEWNLSCAFKEIPLVAATPMAYPLGNLHHEERIPPPAAGTIGLTSRYVRMASVEVWSKHISESLHWQNMQGDPAFTDIDWDAPLIPVQEMVAYIQESRRSNVQSSKNKAQSPEVKVQASWQDDAFQPSRKRSRSQDTQGDIDQQLAQEGSSEKRQRTDSKQDNVTHMPIHRDDTPSIDNNDPWAPSPRENAEPSKTLDPTEALLASLGVTGSPKPVQDGAEFHVPLSVIQSFDGLPEGSPTKPISPQTPQQPYRQDSEYGSVRNTYTGIDSAHRQPTGKPTNWKNWKSSTRAPPPPPPPPANHRSQGDGVCDSPASEESPQQRTREGTVPLEDFPEPGNSPLSPTSAELLGQVPAPQSGDKRPEAKRQADDIMSRMKKKQPKVADAYSRRW